MLATGGWRATSVGIVTIVCAALGLLYNVVTAWVSFRGAFADLVSEHHLVWFYPAFYVMSAVCVACYLVLLWAGYGLTRRWLSAYRLLISTWLFEIGYFLAIQMLCWIPNVGESIAGALGVANGGMNFQFFILLPLWGPLAVLWLRRRQSLPSGV